LTVRRGRPLLGQQGLNLLKVQQWLGQKHPRRLSWETQGRVMLEG
jgi:hypothetical protein